MADSENSGAGAVGSESQPNEKNQSGAEGGGGGGITPKPGTPLRSMNALVPFGAVIAVTFSGMLLDGAAKIEAGGNQVRCGGFCELDRYVEGILRGVSCHVPEIAHFLSYGNPAAGCVSRTAVHVLLHFPKAKHVLKIRSPTTAGSLIGRQRDHRW